MKNAADTVSNVTVAIHTVHGNEPALSRVRALNETLPAFPSPVSGGVHIFHGFSAAGKRTSTGSKFVSSRGCRNINHPDEYRDESGRN